LLRNEKMKKNDDNLEQEDSTHLFQLLTDTLAGNSESKNKRKLRSDLVAGKSYHVRSVKVKSSSQDVDKFKSNEEEKEEEMKLGDWAMATVDGKEINSKDDARNEWEKVMKEKDDVIKSVLKEKEEMKEQNDAIMKHVLKEEEEMMKENEETKEKNDALIKNVLKEKNEELHEMKKMMEHILEKVKQ
jgi:hypothetical protein